MDEVFFSHLPLPSFSSSSYFTSHSIAPPPPPFLFLSYSPGEGVMGACHI